MGFKNKIYQYWAVVAAEFEEITLEEMVQKLPRLRVDCREDYLSQLKFSPMNAVPCGSLTFGLFKLFMH